jgi:hypothetical protein
MAQSFAQWIKLLVNYMFSLYSILDKIKYFNLKTCHISTSNICCWGFCKCVIPFYSLFHQFIYLLDILATGTRWCLWWKWTWSGHVSSMRSHLFNKSRPVLVSCRLLQKGCLNQNRRLLIYIYPKVCIRSLHMLFSWCYWYNDICCIVLRCCTWSLACFQERTERCAIYFLLFGVFSNQIRKGPSFLMSLFCCRATWH